jgi:hypothetical protein
VYERITKAAAALSALAASLRIGSFPFLKRLSRNWSRFAESGVQLPWQPHFRPDIFTTLRIGKALNRWDANSLPMVAVSWTL